MNITVVTGTGVRTTLAGDINTRQVHTIRQRYHDQDTYAALLLFLYSCLSGISMSRTLKFIFSLLINTLATT
ncbi:MAG: hypothetical protein GX905_06030 [Bacteroidales bacterium]|nr:hypothetical protein [Bacteroidales bacterium]